MAAAVVMDTRDMTADTTERARRFPLIPSTPLREVAARQLGAATEVAVGRPPLDRSPSRPVARARGHRPTAQPLP